jgi:hypothetical protein
MLADGFPVTAPAGLDGWLVIALFVLAGYWLCRQIYLSHFPLPPPVAEGSQYVTHSQMDSRLERMERDMEELKRRSDKSTEEVAKRFEKMEDYLHQSFHQNSQGQQVMMTDMKWMKGVMLGKYKLEGGMAEED